MSAITVIPVETGENVSVIATMAKKIWYEHYSTIITEGQIAYMLEKYQSEQAIERQLKEEGYRYFLMEYDGQPAGYFGIQEKDGDLFLSKLYVDAPYRKKGLAAHAIEQLCALGKKDGLGKIWLTVNKDNSGSIAAYLRLGFVKARAQVTDIGGGYVMDDYIMEKQIG